MSNRKGQYNDSEDRQLCRALYDDWADVEASYLGGVLDIRVERSEQRGVFVLVLEFREPGKQAGCRIYHRLSRRWPNGHPSALLAELTTMTWEMARLCEKQPPFLPR
jgi:hypothetical protein